MMNIARTPLVLALALLLAAVFAAGWAPSTAQAQFFDESLEQEDLFVEGEDQFFESSGDEFGAPTGPEQDFTEGNQYIDETLIPPDQREVSEGGRRFQMQLTSERETLPLNVAWGAGTGLLLGGWFALISEGDNRGTQRSIGMGIVAGIIIGAVVGTRTLIDPGAPQPLGETSPPPAGDDSTITPLVTVTPDEQLVGIRLTF